MNKPNKNKSPKLIYNKFRNINFPSDSELSINEEPTEEDLKKSLADLFEINDVDKFIKIKIDEIHKTLADFTFSSTDEDKENFIEYYIFNWLSKIDALLDNNSDLSKEIKIERIKYATDFDNHPNFKNEAIKLGLSGKSIEQYVKNQTMLYEKEKRYKVEEEAKLLGTEMQQLLPEMFEDKRAIPNSFLRGALFGMVRKGRRKLVGEEPIFTMSHYDLSFTGFELDQNDLEVWDTLMYLAKERCIDSELRITLYDLCQQLRLKDNNINREAVIKRIERLKIGTVKIKTANKTYFGSLIDDGYIDTSEDGKLVIRYNKKLAPLFVEDYTFVSADIRHLLGDSQLARWLYSFYESHENPIPLAINFIQKLCRSESQSKEFKRLIVKSLNEVKKAKISVNPKSKWDFHITPDNSLQIFPNGKKYKQKSQTELF